MAASEAGAARERAHRERAERRVAGVLGSQQDRAGRAELGSRSQALADAFDVPGPGSSRTLQDVIDEYVQSRWQDRLGLTRGFEHVRDVAGEGEWGEQVACVRHLYRETDHAITGDKAFQADVREEVEVLSRKAGATEFDMALVRIDRLPGVVDLLHRHEDGSAYALPRFPPLPPRRGSFEAETWDSHLATLSAEWAESRRGEDGPGGGAEVDRAVRDGYLALRGAAFFKGGSHYSAERDQPPPLGAARSAGPGAGRRDGSAAGAGAEAGADAASAADRSAGRASGEEGAARDADAPSHGQSPRRGRDDDGDSLAKRLAGSGDHADHVVCRYIVDCFDGAVQKVVAAVDRRLSRLTGEKDPAVVARGIEKELAEGREALRREVESARARVVDEVRETLGPGYRMGSDAGSAHAPAAGVDSAGGAVERARAEFRRDAESARRETVEAVHGLLGGEPRFGAGRQDVVPEGPARPAPDPAAVAARDARAEFVGSPRAVVVGHVTQASLMVAAARGPQSLARMGELIDRSPLRQAGLETVGCDPVLVKLCADVRGSGREPPRGSALGTLAADLGARHLARCREEPAAAERDEAAFRRGRAALRSGACATRAAEVERGYAPACRVEIDARIGRVPQKVPADRDLAGQQLSLEGRAWLGRMREHSVAAEAPGPDRVVVEGAPRGAVRSFLGRRGQGFERVVQLAGTRRGRVAAAVSSRLLRWGTSGSGRRLKVAGLLLGGSKHLMAGLVRAEADPVAVAAAASPGAARAIAAGAAGASSSLADGARAADHRRLVQVAEELDRRQSAAELTSGGSGSARTARLEHWADYRGRRGAAARMLRALHADRHQAITERVSREKDRALEAKRSGDRDFDLLRERVRDGGVRVWAEAWRGRGAASFDGRDWRFDGRRTHPDGAGAPGSAADGVKAMLAISGGRVRHGVGARLKVGKDLAVEVPQGLGDEQRQSALIYGAAKTIVLGRNPRLAPSGRETVALSGMLASAMAQRLDATYDPPGEARKVDCARVGDDVLRRGNALVQEVGAEVRQRMEAMPGGDAVERQKELDHQVDLVVSRSFAERPRRARPEKGRAAARSVGGAAERVVDIVPGRG